MRSGSATGLSGFGDGRFGGILGAALQQQSSKPYGRRISRHLASESTTRAAAFACYCQRWATRQALILDFLEWFIAGPRPYGEVMHAWRTSCPRLAVWEDAIRMGWFAGQREERSQWWS